MNLDQISFYKAAFFYAAFLFLNLPASAKPITSIENIRNKTSELLVLKQKDKALQLIQNYLKTERSRIYRNEASELLFDLGQSFITREAQQEYETSLIETLENEKKSLKSAENCLKLEPDNLDCMIQRARMNHRLQNKVTFEEQMTEIRNLFSKSNYESVFQLFIERQKGEIKDKQVMGALPSTPTDRSLFQITLEIERSFQAKNYSRVNELVLLAEKHFMDWPDIAYFKNRLNHESTENESKTTDDMLTLYQNKCKNLSRSVTRKYRYDFDLCRRG